MSLCLFSSTSKQLLCMLLVVCTFECVCSLEIVFLPFYGDNDLHPICSPFSYRLLIRGPAKSLHLARSRVASLQTTWWHGWSLIIIDYHYHIVMLHFCRFFIEFVIYDFTCKLHPCYFTPLGKHMFLTNWVWELWNWALTKLQMSRMRHENKVLQHELERLDSTRASRASKGVAQWPAINASNYGVCTCMVRTSSLATKWLACAIKRAPTTKTRRITWSIPVTKVFLLSIAWICIVKSRAEIGFLVMAATSSWQIKIRNLNRSCNCWKCHLSFGKSMQLVRKEPRSKAYEGWHQAELLGGLHKSASMLISLSMCIHGMWGHCGNCTNSRQRRNWILSFGDTWALKSTMPSFFVCCKYPTMSYCGETYLVLVCFGRLIYFLDQWK